MIKIIATNAPKIDAMLKAANGRATEHVYAAYGDIADLAIDAEQRLESLGIPKAQRSGAELFAVSGARVSNAYKWARTATAVRLVRRSSGWFITSASAATIWEKGGKVDLMLTEEQDAIAVQALRSGYRVQRPAAAVAS